MSSEIERWGDPDTKRWIRSFEKEPFMISTSSVLYISLINSRRCFGYLSAQRFLPVLGNPDQVALEVIY